MELTRRVNKFGNLWHSWWVNENGEDMVPHGIDKSKHEAIKKADWILESDFRYHHKFREVGEAKDHE